MIESKPFRIDYRHLNRVCAYCPAEAAIIAVTTMTDGDVIVRTLCKDHGVGEQKHARESGMALIGKSIAAGVSTDATLMDADVIREMAEKMDATGFDSETMKDLASDVEAVSKLKTVKLSDFE